MQPAQRKDLLTAFKQVANLSQIPFRIECFDNSHLGGTLPVSAMVVFEQAKPNKHAYRRFLIKQAEGGDEYDGMREVLRRRFIRGLSENNEGWELPQLLIVDGGTGQLNVALEVLDELDVSGVDVIGVVKPRTHRKRGDMDMPDRIVSPDLIEPVAAKEIRSYCLFSAFEMRLTIPPCLTRRSSRKFYTRLIWTMYPEWGPKPRKRYSCTLDR